MICECNFSMRINWWYGQILGITPVWFLWIFIIQGCMCGQHTKNYLWMQFLNENTLMVWANIRYNPVMIFVNFHNPECTIRVDNIKKIIWLQFLNERIKCWYGKMLGMSPERFLWIFIILGCTIRVTTIKNFFLMQFLNERIKCWYGKIVGIFRGGFCEFS